MSNNEQDRIHTHLTMLQSIIQRMATNSASSKTWCITLVSAILVVVADKSKAEIAFITLIPIILFFSLDSYYLALEKSLRDNYDEFVSKLKNNKLTNDDFYKISTGNLKEKISDAICSFSVWPFYSAIIIMAFTTYVLVK